MRVPGATCCRDHASRQRKHEAAITQKRGTHGTQHEQQPVVTRKEHGCLFARALGIGIATGQAARHEFDGLNEQHQKHIGEKHVFGQQHRIVGEHRHKRKEQQDGATDRQAHAQLAQRRYGIGQASGRNDILDTSVDGEARIGAVKKRKSQLHARADDGRMHYRVMSVEQHVGVKQAQVIARAVGIVEPLADLRTRISHKETGQ